MIRKLLSIFSPKIKSWNFPYEKKILAVDFDGTISKKDNRIWTGNRYKNDIIEPNEAVIQAIKKLQEDNYIILWTARYGKGLRSAVKFCEEQGIRLDAVNQNLVPFKTSRKIVADFYIDDKAVKEDRINEIIISDRR